MKSDYSSKEEVHNRALKIKNIRQSDLIKQLGLNIRGNKNAMGDVFEAWFGKAKDNSSEPDLDSFVHLYRDQGKVCPSTTTVYRCIDAGLLKLDNMVLPKKLRCRVKGDKNAHKRKNKKRYGDSIELRPAAVNDLTSMGHWEGDLVKGIRSADESQR